ncbi:MAG: hypothetical protein ACLUD2_18770 [Clostridium sp.]
MPAISASALRALAASVIDVRDNGVSTDALCYNSCKCLHAAHMIYYILCYTTVA